MSGIASAALILSLALVVLPGSPRCRLTPDDTGRRVLLVGARRVAWGVGCVAVGVAALLPLPTVVAVAVLGATLGLRYRRRRRYLRRSREGQALEAALELVVGELRAGAHPVRAFSIAADETGGPVAVALRGRGAGTIGCRRHGWPARCGPILGAARVLGAARGLLATGQ